MKKKISILLVSILCLSIVLSMNTSAFCSTQKMNDNPSSAANMLFVSDNASEQDFINNPVKFTSNEEFKKTNKFRSLGFNEFGKNVSFKGVKGSNEDQSDDQLLNVDTIAISYDLLQKQSIINYAKRQLEVGKEILFYGSNIDKQNFCKMFGMESCIYKEVPGKEPATKDLVDVSSDKLSYVGVVKGDFGYTLITGADSDYNFYRTVDHMMCESIYSKKAKEVKPYNDVKKDEKAGTLLDNVSYLFSGNQAYAAGVDDYPIVNNQRKNTSFNAGYWYLISDCYLHRVADSDPTYDYFILETISELNTQYQYPTYVPADQFYTKLTPQYSSDIVRSGGPASQGGTTQVSVNFYPPSVGFIYTPGDDVAVDSTFTLSGNYFEAYYKSPNNIFGATSFTYKTIHRTDLSFSVYAPTSNYTWASVNIYQKARQSAYSTWYDAFNPTNYYYDY